MNHRDENDPLGQSFERKSRRERNVGRMQDRNAENRAEDRGSGYEDLARELSHDVSPEVVKELRMPPGAGGMHEPLYFKEA